MTSGEKSYSNTIIIQKVNQMHNFLRRWNLEIQGVLVVDSENSESLAMSTLKVVDPRIERKNVFTFKRMKPARMAEDKKKFLMPSWVHLDRLSIRLNPWKRKRKLANTTLDSLCKTIEKLYVKKISDTN